MSNLLSKSDFKVAQSCSTKLFYKKEKYPNSNDENEFMKMLAQGGYLIGKYTQLMYPEGKEIKERNSLKAFRETLEKLKEKNIVIFEAAIISNSKVIRIDILEKKGNLFNIIEVKAKSDNSEEEEKIEKEYLEDITFQTVVLDEYLTENFKKKFEIHSFLFLPDKAKNTNLEGLPSWFRKKPAKFEYEFLHAINGPENQLLIKDSFMNLKNVDEKVKELRVSVVANSKQHLKSLNPLIRMETAISKDCFTCEYKVEETSSMNGYKECWKELAYVNPHISELYYIGTLGKNELANIKISEKKVSLFDIYEEELVTAKGELGTRNHRQLIQIQNTKNNTEFFSEDGKEEIQNWTLPYYFIDFETATPVMPYHKGMCPYELIAFQWSCHEIEKIGDAPKHYEWINTENSFPNFRFAESLMELVAQKGTPFMFATHENTVLREILNQMERRDYINPALKTWLTNITKDKSNNRPGRFIDMNAFCLKHYFHPDMKGKTSIKKTLPAIWNNNPYLHEKDYLKEYVKRDATGKIMSPYDALPALSDDVHEDAEEVIREGTAAMRAYHQLMFEIDKNKIPEKFEEKKQLLLQYCKLDTMAMVIIWEHWRKLIG